MNTIAKVVLGLLGLGTAAAIVVSVSKPKKPFRLTYIKGTSWKQGNWENLTIEEFDTKEDAEAVFKKRIKTDSYVTLEKRNQDDSWKDLKYNIGLGEKV